MLTLTSGHIGTRLRELGIATTQQLDQACQELASTQERFSVILTKLGVLRDPDAGKRLAPQLGALPQRFPEPPGETPSSTKIPAAVWRGHRLVPLRETGGTLLVGTDDPLSVFALEMLGRKIGCPVEAVLLAEPQATSLLSGAVKSEPVIAPPPKVPAPPATSKSNLTKPVPSRPAVSPVAARAGDSERRAGEPGALRSGQGGEGTSASEAASADEPIIALVDSMLAEAVRLRASDIHLQPASDTLRVRYRIDGVLHDVNSPPKALQGPLVSRIKIMAGLNIAEKRLPQDGRLQLAVEKRPMDVRVSTLPSTHGESIVMRLLDRSQPARGLPEMGLGEEDQRRWLELVRRPHGMVLVTGPTGSGKTTTLYGALSTLNEPDRKLITVEDPVEYQLAGVNQVAVKPGIGLTFAAGLRSMLRQAPDVIMVGEIRDQETAQVAVQAALTGHLVLTTLHTNDAPSAITRLIDMGVPPFLVASTVQGIMAQRLVRRICPACRLTDNATAEERAFLGAGTEVLQVIRSTGCDKCRGTGFLGRIGVFELLVMSDALRQLVVGKASAAALRRQAAKEGMTGLRDDGVQKVREGLTTAAEVLRVVSDA